jgi:hypothetical protein
MYSAKIHPKKANRAVAKDRLVSSQNFLYLHHIVLIYAEFSLLAGDNWLNDFVGFLCFPGCESGGPCSKSKN